MSSAILLPLLLAVQAEPSPQQPVLSLDVWPRSFVRYGEPVEVTVHTDRDGFLTVLRVDTHGRLHVLFPLDPTDDAFVEAGGRLRVYARYGNHAFAAFERDGEGTVLAALSDDRYDFSGFSSGSRWSYAVMGVHYAGADHVEAMRDFVRQAAGSDQFDLAVARYWVSGVRRFGGYGGYRNAGCFGYDRFGSWTGSPWGWRGWGGWGSGWGFYHAYDPLHPVGYFPLHSLWYDDLLYSPYDCYGWGRGYFGYPGGGTIVIIRDRPGLPVDRSGFKKKKGTVVKPYEPRRRDPAAAGEATAVTRDRTRDLRSFKPARRPDSEPERRWSGEARDRTAGRPRHDPQERDVRQRDFSKRDGDGGGQRDFSKRRGDGGGDNGRHARPERHRPDRDRSVDLPASQRPAADRPAPPRRTVERPAPPPRPAVERPAQKPKEKPAN